MRISIRGSDPIFIALWIWLIASLSPVKAEEARPVCIPDAALRERLEAVGATGLRSLSGRARDSAVAFYNAQPPESDKEFDDVMVAEFQGGAVMVLGGAGQWCGQMMLPPPVWQRLRVVLEGQPV